MEFHALTDVADPAHCVGFIDPPAGKQAWGDIGQLVGMGEVPVHDENRMPGSRGSGNPRRRCSVCRGWSANPTRSCRCAAPGGKPPARECQETPRPLPPPQEGHAWKLSCRVLELSAGADARPMPRRCSGPAAPRSAAPAAGFAAGSGARTDRLQYEQSARTLAGRSRTARLCPPNASKTTDFTHHRPPDLPNK